MVGIGLDWYIRLEQGRARPSVAVLERLMQLFGANEAERAHLLAMIGVRLDRPRPYEDLPVGRALQHVLDSWNPFPAFVLNHRWDTIAWNRAACLVLADYASLPKPARNLARIMFLDPQAQHLVGDWEANARRLLAQLHADYGQHLDDPEFGALVDDLTQQSKFVRASWAPPSVGGPVEVLKLFRHPLVGELWLEQSGYLVESSPGWRMALYLPHDESTRCKLVQLATG